MRFVDDAVIRRVAIASSEYTLSWRGQERDGDKCPRSPRLRRLLAAYSEILVSAHHAAQLDDPPTRRQQMIWILWSLKPHVLRIVGYKTVHKPVLGVSDVWIHTCTQYLDLSRVFAIRANITHHIDPLLKDAMRRAPMISALDIYTGAMYEFWRMLSDCYIEQSLRSLTLRISELDYINYVFNMSRFPHLEELRFHAIPLRALAANPWRLPRSLIKLACLCESVSPPEMARCLYKLQSTTHPHLIEIIDLSPK